ncbi:MAG TPA: pitrilysin family protein [Vicinamibacterales bacterium]|jgi:predicted Zn-dependent peptidase|nr:pitrilysin family protein [Vicinamibacterales bacterium]
MAVDRSHLPDVGPDPSFAFPSIVHHTLANGLRVRAVEHHSVPIITLALQLDGGSGGDTPGREGLAALVADMVDEGTGSLNAIDVSDALARIGGDYDIDVGPDATTFSLTTLTRFAERGASLLAAMVTTPALRDADFERVKRLRLDRLRQLKDSPPALAERAFLRLMYGSHPYGHLPIGADETLRRLTPADVATLHRDRFGPAAATMVVAGAMAAADLIALVDRAFGQWSAASDGSPETPASALTSFPMPPRLALVARDAAAQSELRIGHLSARRDTPDYPALLVMNAVLGGQFVSRINLKLREEKGYTYGARTGFDWHKGLSPFALQASVHTVSTVDAIRDALAELEGIRGNRPPTPQELGLAKASLTRGYPRNFETAQQVARAVTQLALHDLPDTYFAEFVPKVHAVTADALVAAAHTYLDPSRLTTLIVGDYAAIRDTLPSLNLGEPELLPIDV